MLAACAHRNGCRKIRAEFLPIFHKAKTFDTGEESCFDGALRWLK
jgi:hypothetical protein